MKISSKFAAAAIGGTMALSAIAPAVANAQVIGFNSGYGSGSGFNNGNLGQLFVLGTLFGGQYGNGVIGSGTSLGDLLILNQIFNHNSGGGMWW